MNPKNTYLPVIFSILITAAFMVTLKGCTTTNYTYGLVGRPAVSDDGKLAAVLVAESQGTTYQENGGYRSTTYNSSYWLKLYETATGKFLKKKKIVEAAEKRNLLPLSYGGYRDKIWLHTNGLSAYDINNLEEVVNQEKLAKQNAFDENNFPDDQRFINEMVFDGYIRFTSIAGDKYRITLANLELRSEKEIPLNTAEKMNEQLRYQMPGNITYGVRSDTAGSTIYILAKDSATAMNSYPGNSDDGPVYIRLYMFTASYLINRIGNHRFYRYSNMKRLSGSSYLNAIFLKDFASGKIVHPQQPASYVVLHNDSLSNNARSMLTAIDGNNSTLWQINTGLSTKLSNCIVKNKYCILTGNNKYLVGPHIGSDMLCIVNLESGKMVTPSITE